MTKSCSKRIKTVAILGSQKVLKISYATSERLTGFLGAIMAITPEHLSLLRPSQHRKRKEMKGG